MNFTFIKENAKLKGFTVVDVDWSKKPPYVTLRCKKGHLKGCSAYKILNHKTICRICDGKRFDLHKAKNLLESEGYSLKGIPTLDKDRYGNEILKAGTRFTLLCPNGHEINTTLNSFCNGKRCTKCSGKIFYTGYSRWEEIIAKVLDYAGILYIRQYKLPEEYGGLFLDFYLPDRKMIIEYDGEQHVYGRSTDPEEKLAETRKCDAIRDKYACSINYQMIRINHNIEGKAIVYAISSIFNEVDAEDPYYDKIVKQVFDDAAERFGWLSYNDIKVNADTYLYNSLSKSSSITGYSQTVIARHFRWVYGMNKMDYLKNR